MHARRRRKRSAAITLVLVGSLAGCDRPEQQRDVYTSLADCSKDWLQPAECEPVRDGRFSNSYFYGPGYYGASFPSGRPRPSPNAFDAVHAGGTSSALSSVRSSSGVGTSSSAARGGFGASARASSGG
jgi:hypothetical protein